MRGGGNEPLLFFFGASHKLETQTQQSKGPQTRRSEQGGIPI